MFSQFVILKTILWKLIKLLLNTTIIFKLIFGIFFYNEIKFNKKLIFFLDNF